MTYTRNMKGWGAVSLAKTIQSQSPQPYKPSHERKDKSVHMIEAYFSSLLSFFFVVTLATVSRTAWQTKINKQLQQNLTSIPVCQLDGTKILHESLPVHLRLVRSYEKHRTHTVFLLSILYSKLLRELKHTV